VGAIHAWLAVGVVVSTAATDAVYVMFSAAVASRRRLPAATWSSVWYLLSAFAVISYTRNWVYVCFAALGSWIGAYLSMTFLRRNSLRPDHGESKTMDWISPNGSWCSRKVQIGLRWRYCWSCVLGSQNGEHPRQFWTESVHGAEKLGRYS